MKANRTLLQMKYARVIVLFVDKAGISLSQALDFFYSSFVYRLISEGVSDMHCRSDEYLAEELEEEYENSKAYV